MKSDALVFSQDEAHSLAVEACLACGASAAVSHSLAAATVSAEVSGRASVGFRHLANYLQGFIDGRIAGDAEPIITSVLPTVIHSDAARGIAQFGFDLAYDRLVENCKTYGTMLFAQKNSYTAGELGYYVRRLALDGLVSIATANGSALMAATPETGSVYCTNPLAFGAPSAAFPSPMVIDQASSATAFVNIVKAAEVGGTIPEGWAVDASGAITTDARAAVTGSLLPFGGYKGANIALMTEVLSAGVTGASWSTDAGNFRSGSESPRAGLTVFALAPSAIDPEFEPRLGEHLKRLQKAGVHLPGIKPSRTQIELDRGVVEHIRAYVQKSS